MDNFYLKVKSSIDKLAYDVASALSIGAVELDDVTNVEEDLAGDADLVVYQMVDLQPDPLDPLYSVQFEVGIKTTRDVSNFDMATLISTVQEMIEIDDTFYLRDYSGITLPTEDIGYMYITGTNIDPQMFDGASGIRMQRCGARVVRYLS